jgi:hypothetical protein
MRHSFPIHLHYVTAGTSYRFVLGGGGCSLDLIFSPEAGSPKNSVKCKNITFILSFFHLLLLFIHLLLSLLLLFLSFVIVLILFLSVSPRVFFLPPLFFSFSPSDSLLPVSLTFSLLSSSLNHLLLLRLLLPLYVFLILLSLSSCVFFSFVFAFCSRKD